MPHDAPPPSPQDLDRQLRMLRVICISMAGSSVLHIGLVASIRTDAGFPPLVSFVCGGFGVLMSLASFPLRSVLLGRGRLARVLHTNGEGAVIRAIVQGHLFTWLLADASVALGMVVGFMGAPPVLAYGLIAFGTAIVLSQWPGATVFQDLLVAAEDERIRMGLADTDSS